MIYPENNIGLSARDIIVSLPAGKSNILFLNKFMFSLSGWLPGCLSGWLPSSLANWLAGLLAAWCASSDKTLAMLSICMHHLSAAMPLSVGGIAAKRWRRCR